MLVWSHLGGAEHRLHRTLSDNEDSGAVAGFSIANVFYRGADVDNLTANSTSNALEIAVYTDRDLSPPKRVTAFDLVSNNSAPRGVWGNEETIWVANDGSGATDKLYAYNRSDRSRDSSSDFDTLNTPGNNNPRGDLFGWDHHVRRRRRRRQDLRLQDVRHDPGLRQGCHPGLRQQ